MPSLPLLKSIAAALEGTFKSILASLHKIQSSFKKPNAVGAHPRLPPPVTYYKMVWMEAISAETFQRSISENL